MAFGIAHLMEMLLLQITLCTYILYTNIKKTNHINLFTPSLPPTHCHPHHSPSLIQTHHHIPPLLQTHHHQPKSTNQHQPKSTNQHQPTTIINIATSTKRKRNQRGGERRRQWLQARSVAPGEISNSRQGGFGRDQLQRLEVALS